MYLGDAAAIRALEGWKQDFEQIARRLEANPSTKLAKDLQRVADQAKDDLATLDPRSKEYEDYKAYIKWAEDIGDESEKYLESLASWVIPDRKAIQAIVIRADAQLGKELMISTRKHGEGVLKFLKIAAIAGLGLTVWGLWRAQRKAKRR